MYPFVIPRRQPTTYPGMWRDLARGAREGLDAVGPHVERFEEAFAHHVGAPYAVATPSGRHAMELILDAFGLGPGDEVLTPAYTLETLSELIAARGPSVTFADVRADTYNLDLDSARRACTERTCALMATHLFGVPADVGGALRLAETHGAVLIEDCAHALGATVDGPQVGTFGRASFFSFATVKAVNTFGGGMVVTSDEGLYREVKERVAKYPVEPGDVWQPAVIGFVERLLGFRPLYGLTAGLLFQTPALARTAQALYRRAKKNVRTTERAMSDFKAFLGLRQMNGLAARIAHRRELGHRYERRLDGVVHVQETPAGAERVYYNLIVDVPRAPQVRPRLFRRGVDAGVGREVMQFVRADAPDVDAYPVAGRLADTALELPMFDAMTLADVDAVTDAVTNLVSGIALVP